MDTIAGEGGHSKEWNSTSKDVNYMTASLSSGGEGSTGLRLNTDTPAAQSQLTKLMGAGSTDEEKRFSQVSG